MRQRCPQCGQFWQQTSDLKCARCNYDPVTDTPGWPLPAAVFGWVLVVLAHLVLIALVLRVL